MRDKANDDQTHGSVGHDQRKLVRLDTISVWTTITYAWCINWRSYVVCDVAYKNVNNWLWTPFIERLDANRIYIEIKFSMRDCNLFPGMALSCKETFSLLYYEFDAQNKEPPPWEPESYKLIDRIAADEGRFTSNSEVIINTEIRSIPVTKKGVYFAFRDQGACLSLIAIKIFYVVCPNVTMNFAYFPETPTGKELTAIVPAEGSCVANAVEVEKPRLLCKGDGNWTLPSGGCKCMPGYEPVGQTCQVCPPSTFKPVVGDELCGPCPAHSTAPYRGSIECRCDHGYYRAPKDPKWFACTQPPSAPQNLTLTLIDQFSVTLSWSPPKYNGGRNDTIYRVECDGCSSVSYNPSQEHGLNETKITVSGLSPMTTYRFLVYAENGVSGHDPSQYAEITATTESSVPSPAVSISNVRVVNVKPTEILLAWDASDASYSNEGSAKYEVKYYQKGFEHNSSTIESSKEEVTIRNLKQRTEYAFQVRSKASSEYTRPLFQTTGHLVGSTAYIGDDDSVQVRIIAGVSVAIVVLVIVIIVMIVLYLRKNTDECNKKQPSDCDTLEYTRNGEALFIPSKPSNQITLKHAHRFSSALSTVVPSLEHPPIVPTARFNSPFSVTTPLFTHCGTSRSYVDPHTYEDPNQAIREFTKEIDASHITIEAIIGGGEFGDVCRGKLKLPGRPEVTVAIKTLKQGASEKPRMDFLTEASIMGQFDHPNVIYLQGVVTKSNPIMIITEYMDNGSLDAFLRANEAKFQLIQLVGMLRGIAAGMQYLAEMNYVHRDLAARNVLVNAALVCKIADFGLSREIESATEGAYTTRGGKIPVRWTAPEAIAFRKFTSASDVWSFGIVCWEVLSYGERPYWNWSNQDVIKGIEKGYRLPPPVDCPEALHQLMLDCWQKDRSQRPSFLQIVKTLDKLLRCPESLQQIAQTRYFQNDPFTDCVIPDVIQFKTVDEWLASIKMTRYRHNFEQAGITNLGAVSRLTPQDLAIIGVTLVSHQKKIMNSIQTLRAQTNIGTPEGFLV
ncbi:ephrin type-B receptor 1-B-like protein [Dinothrombium tinctorium]|uniref:receptor protein-tyrosine kinase n=1 Tax=Dinothrombium tinctorium TaxID=1965070 RepID=A0A443RMP1_9ACAR|nr:ephrin type-B receptor 1-B-like protein [Dinothrombium tinctorium]